MRHSQGRILNGVGLLLALAFIAAAAAPAAFAAPTATSLSRVSTQDTPPPEVRYADANDGTGPLKDMHPLYNRLKDIIPMPDEAGLPGRDNPAQPIGQDPVAQPPSGGSAPAPLNSFEGINNVNGVLPPDTNGDISPNYYVQTVNLSFAVWDRSGNKLYGPANINTLWQGFGGSCETSNDGDPIVLYDHLADRWLISQFALPRYPFGPFYQCIAISQTNDPTGSWWRYQFTYSRNKMNDYPHFGVWPDGYYMTANQFSSGSGSWAGQGAVVFERDKMLQGQTARMVYFDLYSTDSNLGGMLPSHLNGPVPPTGEPNHFMEMDDNAWGYVSNDQVQMWDFHVDWTTTANSTFKKVGAWQTAPFDSDMCGGARNCVPQPGGTKVDAIADRLMYRLQYRNFGSYQTLMLNHTVDVDGTDHAGVRWYELRKTGGTWGIYQQGTYAPDANHRWMASVAMNGQGDVGLGFSISSTSYYPSIHYTGRFAGDTLGEMTQGEASLVEGSGWQDHSSGRWGDYSSLSVDPKDDCTFWYTQEYMTSQTAGNAAWQTRWGSFKLRDCGTVVDNPPAVSISSPANGDTVSGTINVTASASDDHGVSQVQFFADGNSIGTDTNGADGWSVSWNTTGVPNGSHSLTAKATDTASQTTTSSAVSVNVSNGGTPTTLHVGDLDGVSATLGARWQAKVTVTVHDATHAIVSGATVNGSWTSGASGSGSCTTDSTGKCTITSSYIQGRTTSATFQVTGISKSGYSYDGSMNHDPETDSNGTTITVKK